MSRLTIEADGIKPKSSDFYFYLLSFLSSVALQESTIVTNYGFFSHYSQNSKSASPWGK